MISLPIVCVLLNSMKIADSRVLVWETSGVLELGESL